MFDLYVLGVIAVVGWTWVCGVEVEARPWARPITTPLRWLRRQFPLRIGPVDFAPVALITGVIVLRSAWSLGTGSA